MYPNKDNEFTEEEKAIFKKIEDRLGLSFLPNHLFSTKRSMPSYRPLITLYDVRNRTRQELDAEKMLDEETLKTIKKIEQDMDIKIKVSEVTKTENFIIKYYKQLGYEVIITGLRAAPSNLANKKDKIPEEVMVELLEKHSISNEHFGVGVPDLFVYNPKNISDLTFVEVKSKDGNFSMPQVDWLLSTTVPMKIAYITSQVENEWGNYKKDDDYERDWTPVRMSFYSFENKRRKYEEERMKEVIEKEFNLHQEIFKK